MEDSIKIKGVIDFKLKYNDGSVKEWTVNNLITSAGRAQLALLAGDASATPFTYIAVGTSNTAVNVSQTALQGEISTNGLSRVAATVSRTTTTVTNDTLQLTTTFSVSGTSTVEEVGIFNASSTGTMLGRALTSTTALVNGNELTVTYKVIFA